MTSVEARQRTDHSSVPGRRLKFSLLQTVQTYCTAHTAFWGTNLLVSFVSPWTNFDFHKRLTAVRIFRNPFAIGTCRFQRRCGMSAITECHSERCFIREKYTAILRQPVYVLISYFFSNRYLLCYHCILHNLPELWSATQVQNGCRPMVYRKATAAIISRTASFLG